jgi:hypothetical protein
METGSGAEPAIPPWNAEIVRVTLFTPPDIQLNVKWQDLTGEPHETFEDRARERVQRAVGSFGPGVLELLTQPTRLDWVLQPPGTSSPGMSTLGEHSTVIKTFTQAVRAWLSKSPPAIRVAFGTVLHIPVDDRPSGYNLLQSFLPSIQIDAEASTDFFYQINRPRQSHSLPDGQVINRLSRWTVAELRLFQLTSTSGEMQRLAPTTTVFCRLELDLSTAPDNSTPIDVEKLMIAFDEMVAAALEIATRGDVP